MRLLLALGLRLALRNAGWPMTSSASCAWPARAPCSIGGSSLRPSTEIDGNIYFCLFEGGEKSEGLGQDLEKYAAGVLPHLRELIPPPLSISILLGSVVVQQAGL
eukprot:7349690-Pyramimonas_sp.AAC.1